jgi:DnaJ-class molecular chaperone
MSDATIQVVEFGDDPCSDCDGKGFYSGWPHTSCPTCQGTGRQTQPVSDDRLAELGLDRKRRGA